MKSMTKPNLPEEVQPGKQYSFRADLKANAWMWVAIAISAGGDLFLPQQISRLPTTWRILIALIPFVAIALWVRSLAQWISGMDELHRRITVAASLFATSATLFLVTLWNTLVAVSAGSRPAGDIGTVWLLLWLLTVFYLVGNGIFTHRYR